MRIEEVVADLMALGISGRRINAIQMQRPHLGLGKRGNLPGLEIPVIVDLEVKFGIQYSKPPETF